MKFIKKLLFSLLVLALLGGTLFNFGLFYELKEKADTLKKQGLRHFLSIQDKLEVLEDAREVFRTFGEWWESEASTSNVTEAPTEAPSELPEDEPESLPTFSEPQTTPSETLSDETDAPCIETDPTDPETLPSEPETEVSASESESALSAGYKICVFEGIIGVFDSQGVLTETVNVSVMTLPEADRVALEIGIAAANMTEVREILDKLV